MRTSNELDAEAAEDAALVALSRKLRRYAYLLPPPSAQMMDKMTMGNGVPEGTPDPVAPPDPRLRPADWPAPDAAAARDRAMGCLLGLAVGDAVGAGVAFRPRDSGPAVTDMVGGGPAGLPPGGWTGNTGMALCLAETILATGTVDQGDFMERLRGWLERGENTVGGRCLDAGATTRTAIERFAGDGIPSAGIEAAETAGNGSLVRLAPVAIAWAADVAEARLLARKQSRATHAATECIDACALLVSFLCDALGGADKAAATRQRVLALAPKPLFISAGEWREKERAAIRSGGYVIDTLEAALWAVWRGGDFRETVLLAANLGDGCDGACAVAGALAGALYGASGIPAQWLARLAERERIETLAAGLFALRGRAAA